jgi:hypothetical protein
MEEPYKNSEKLAKGWIQEVGLEKPSSSFEIKILQRIEAKRLLQKATPLISTKGWFVLGILFIVGSFLLYAYPSQKISFNNDLDWGIVNKFNSLGTISVSATTQYAFLFLALFLVQLPFLKHYLDKERA